MVNDPGGAGVLWEDETLLLWNHHQLQAHILQQINRNINKSKISKMYFFEKIYIIAEFYSGKYFKKPNFKLT
jgi:hypothetical protein